MPMSSKYRLFWRILISDHVQHSISIELLPALSCAFLYFVRASVVERTPTRTNTTNVIKMHAFNNNERRTNEEKK